MSVGARGVVDAYHAARVQHGRLPRFAALSGKRQSRGPGAAKANRRGGVPRAERSGRPLRKRPDEACLPSRRMYHTLRPAKLRSCADQAPRLRSTRAQCGNCARYPHGLRACPLRGPTRLPRRCARGRGYTRGHRDQDTEDIWKFPPVYAGKPGISRERANETRGPASIDWA